MPCLFLLPAWGKGNYATGGGHNEPRTTMAVYMHVTAAMQQKGIDALDHISI